MGKGVGFLIAGGVVLSLVAAGGIIALALNSNHSNSNDSTSHFYPNSNSHDESSNDKNRPAIKLVFYSPGYSDEVLYETKIYEGTFTWNSNLYQGVEPTLEEDGFENTFLGWFSGEYNQVLKENMTFDINDYEFYDDGYLCERKDGKQSLFHVIRYGDQYECRFWPKFYKKSIDRSIVYQSPSGEIYDVVKAPSRIYWDDDAIIDTSYFGKVPKYYNPDYPVKFNNWEYEVASETADWIATATFVQDFDMTRASFNFSNSYFSRSSNSRFITMIHNETSATATITLFRTERELKEIVLGANETAFFDITDGIDSFSGSISGNSDTKRIVYDYYDNNNYIVPAYNEFDDAYSAWDVYTIDLRGIHLSKPLILTDYARIPIDENNYETLKTERIKLYISENIEILVLNGVKGLEIQGDIQASQNGAFDDLLPKIRFPESIRAFSAYEVRSELSYADGKGIYYLGNDSNPYLVAEQGTSNRIATGCVALTNSIQLYGYDANSEVDEYPEIVIPGSVESIDYVDCNYSTIRFEDLRGLKKLGEIKKATIIGDVEFGKDLTYEEDATLLDDCKTETIKFPNNLVFNRNPVEKCDFEKFAITDVVNNSKLIVRDDELYYDGNLLAVPSAKLEGTYYVKEGVKKIYPDAIDEGRSYDFRYNPIGKLQTVILSNSVEEVGYQSRTGAYFYTKGDVPIFDDIIYGCESDGSLVKRDGLIYGLYNDEAYILGYEQSEVPADLIIPDTITARGGNTYPVTRIKRSALYSINLNSIIFGNNLEVIELDALRYMHINSDFFLPSNIKRIEESAFYGMKLSKEIQITFDTDIVDGIDHHAFYWYYNDIEWAKIIPSFVIKASSYDKFYSFFSFNKFYQFPFLPVKQLITTNGEIDNLGHYYGGFDNDVSNLFVEIDNQKICFNEITEIKSESIRIDMLDLSYYFPRLEKLIIPQNLVESYVYDDGIIVDTHYYSLNELMDILLFDKEDLIETSTTMYQFDNLQIDFYFDMSEEEFIDFVKETTFHVFIEEEGNVNLKFDYDGECFYFNSKYIGIYGIPNWMVEADYEIPLKNNATYIFKIRYSTTA